MSTMEELTKQIKLAKDKEKEEFDKIKYTKNKNSVKQSDLKFESKIVKITSKKQVYDDMKLRFRSKWKSNLYFFSSNKLLQNFLN